ncbi:HAD family hydrolase [Kitasatospora sp. NBC_00240]|uniref:HAD family hydrolase n=1 Tax=Kitasatospora sp. NBC_00240 TaxID=2903567 RepID=UPI0022536000|nr:HAD family hydrolase [Kitasatospora sp. NBC_00240]MCX5211897.1 HAD family hydrolase [Kitasatospora sp. NBC_00240]
MRKLVLIDLDHTLIERRVPVATSIADFCAARGLDPDATRRVAAALKERTCPEAFAALREPLGLPGSTEELWASYVATLAADVTHEPATLTGLDRLRAAGWTVGILSNGVTDVQRAKIRSAGIHHHVDAVCISEEAGARKPDPAIFRIAAERCGHPLTPSTWMVGNNPATDITGATAAGIRSLWISAGHPWTADQPATPDHIEPDVASAAEHLLRLEGAAA